MKKRIMNKWNLLLLLLFGLGNCYSQDGKLLSKRLINLSDVPYWQELSFRDSIKDQYKYLNNLNFYFIKYLSDGIEVNGIMSEPKKIGKYPVVIFNRGGNRDYGSLTLGLVIMYTSKLANQGYVVISSNLREKDEFGGAEINDILNLMETVKEVEKADFNNIGMFGWSRGGMMTYLALKKSNKIKTAIIGNGPTDLFALIKDRPEMETQVTAECIPNYSKNKKLELQKRSVVFWPEKLNKGSSLLILAGTNDERGNSNQADMIAVQLSELKYDFELRKFATDHSFSNMKDDLNEVVINWFNSKLKNIR